MLYYILWNCFVYLPKFILFQFVYAKLFYFKSLIIVLCCNLWAGDFAIISNSFSFLKFYKYDLILIFSVWHRIFLNVLNRNCRHFNHMDLNQQNMLFNIFFYKTPSNKIYDTVNLTKYCWIETSYISNK